MKRVPDWLALATSPVLGALAAYLESAIGGSKLGRNSNDRYVNQEFGYLLRRLEQFRHQDQEYRK